MLLSVLDGSWPLSKPVAILGRDLASLGASTWLAKLQQDMHVSMPAAARAHGISPAFAYTGAHTLHFSLHSLTAQVISKHPETLRAGKSSASVRSSTRPGLSSREQQ